MSAARRANPETAVQRAGLETLGYRPGWRAFRMNTGATRMPSGAFVAFSRKGMPDIIGWAPGGRFFGAEAKRPGGRLSPDQERFLDDLREAGGIAMVFSSVDELLLQMDEPEGERARALFDSYRPTEAERRRARRLS